MSDNNKEEIMARLKKAHSEFGQALNLAKKVQENLKLLFFELRQEAKYVSKAVKDKENVGAFKHDLEDIKKMVEHMEGATTSIHRLLSYQKEKILNSEKAL